MGLWLVRRLWKLSDWAQSAGVRLFVALKL